MDLIDKYEVNGIPQLNLFDEYGSLKGQAIGLKDRQQVEEFVDALNEDLNTSIALSVLFEIGRPLRSLANKISHSDPDVISELANQNLYLRWILLIKLASDLPY